MERSDFWIISSLIPLERKLWTHPKWQFNIFCPNNFYLFFLCVCVCTWVLIPRDETLTDFAEFWIKFLGEIWSSDVTTQNWRAHSFTPMQPAHYAGETQHFSHLNNSCRNSRSPIFFLFVTGLINLFYRIFKSFVCDVKNGLENSRAIFFCLFFLIDLDVSDICFWGRCQNWDFASFPGAFPRKCSSSSSRFSFAWGHLHTSKSAEKTRTLFLAPPVGARLVGIEVKRGEKRQTRWFWSWKVPLEVSCSPPMFWRTSARPSWALSSNPSLLPPGLCSA